MLFRFKVRPYIVWHQDSPGIKLVVFRNWVQNLIYPRCFSGIGEKTYSDSFHVAIDRTQE